MKKDRAALSLAIFIFAVAAYFAVVSVFFGSRIDGIVSVVLLLLLSGKALFTVFSVRGVVLKLVHVAMFLFLLLLVLSMKKAEVEYIEIPVNSTQTSKLLGSEIHLDELTLFSPASDNYISKVTIGAENHEISVNHPLILHGIWIYQYNFKLSPELTTGLLLRYSPFDIPLMISSVFLMIMLVIFVFTRRRA